MHDETKEGLKVIRKPTLVYPVTIQEWPSDDGHPWGYAEVRWNPVERLDLRRFKESIILYGVHLPYLKQMLNSRATQNRTIPQDWKSLAIVVWKLDLSYNDEHGDRGN